MSELTELWKGAFGDGYAKRNRLSDGEVARRIVMWRRVFANIPLDDVPKSFLDVGAGCGANVGAIEAICKRAGYEPQIYGLELNDRAAQWLSQAYPHFQMMHAAAQHIPMGDASVDMAYTYGLLIHISETDLHQAMSEIYRCAARYVFSAEYFNPHPLAIPYHGKEDALFKRDYGSLWVDQFPLRVLAYGFEWKRFSGLDDVTWWLMEKTQ